MECPRGQRPCLCFPARPCGLCLVCTQDYQSVTLSTLCPFSPRRVQASSGGLAPSTQAGPLSPTSIGSVVSGIVSPLWPFMGALVMVPNTGLGDTQFPRNNTDTQWGAQPPEL